jgi:hypothetical protein
MAHCSPVVRTLALSPILALLVGCSGSSGGGGETSAGGSVSGGSSAAPGGGATASGGSGNSATSGTTTVPAGGATAAGGSNAAGRSGATGGSAVAGAGTGGRGTGGQPGGGVNGTGGVSATGGTLGGGGGSTKSATGGTVGTGGSGANAAGGTSKGGGTANATGGTSKGGGSADATGGTSKGGGSANATGGTSKGGGSANATGGTSKGGGSSLGTGGANGGAGGASGTDATIVPDTSWACGMSGGIPAPTRGTLVFSASLQLGTIHDVGATQYGHRRVIDVKGGTFTGSRIQGSFLTGGLDLELTLSNNAVELEQIDILKTSDGTLIYMRGCGMALAGDSAVRVVPDFEVATSSSYAWLNTGKFAATRVLDSAGSTIKFDVYDISSVTASDPKVTFTVPSGVPAQPWNCSTNTGTKGASVFTETVTLGSSVSIGASKNGTRNIIPITGGTFTGSIPTGGSSVSFKGTILNGGGDYQLAGTSTKLDARYTLASNDGEFVVVRNCGPMGALIPWFETRAAGPYAALNTSAYLSSDPGSASGGVSITFYVRQ